MKCNHYTYEHPTMELTSPTCTPHQPPKSFPSLPEHARHHRRSTTSHKHHHSQYQQLQQSYHTQTGTRNHIQKTWTPPHQIWKITWRRSPQQKSRPTIIMDTDNENDHQQKHLHKITKSHSTSTPTQTIIQPVQINPPSSPPSPPPVSDSDSEQGSPKRSWRNY